MIYKVFLLNITIYYWCQCKNQEAIKDENPLTIIGQPPVLGSSGKQMRHVIVIEGVDKVLRM